MNETKKSKGSRLPFSEIFDLIDHEIEELVQRRDQAVASADYNTACSYRDQAEVLRRIKQKIQTAFADR